MPEVVQKILNGNGVAEITLNRPEVYNVYNDVFLESLRAAYLNFGSNPDVRVILLRGNGKYFSAGADVEWFQKLSKSSRSIQLAAATLSTSTFEVIWQCPKPTIALIHRGCFGGGVGFAAASDIVVAEEKTNFAITEVRLGITPAPILFPLLGAINPRYLKRFATTGETFDSEIAQKIGLVHEISPAGKLDTTIEPIIDNLLKGGPLAVSKTKELINKIAFSSSEQLDLDDLVKISVEGRSGEEGVEGFDAFLQKRDPSWSSRTKS